MTSVLHPTDSKRTKHKSLSKLAVYTYFLITIFYALLPSTDISVFGETLSKNSIENKATTVILNVPYIHQMWDTPDDFEGTFACGAVAAVSIVAYYNRLPKDPIWVNKNGRRLSEYGKYVSKEYSLYGFTYSRITKDGLGRPSKGAYGLIHYNTDGIYGARITYAKEYFYRHGLEAKVLYKPTEDDIKAEIKADRPVWASTKLTPRGHIVVIVGFTSDGRYVINDSRGNPNVPNYVEKFGGAESGKYVIVTWKQLKVNEKWIIKTKPVTPNSEIRILANELNVRTSPSVSSKVVGKVSAGDEGYVLNSGPPYNNCFYNADGYTWWYVKFPGKGLEGWIAVIDKEYKNAWVSIK